MKPREVSHRYNKANVMVNKEQKEKMCSVCNKVKSHKEFNKSSSNKTDRLAGRCRKCELSLRYIVKDTPTTKAKKYNKDHQEENLKNKEKMCVSCNIVKPLEEYNKDKARKDGKQSVCRPCRQAFYTTNDQKKKARMYDDTPERKAYEKERAQRPERKAYCKALSSTPRARKQQKEHRSRPEVKERQRELSKMPHRRATTNAYRQSIRDRPEVRAMNAMRGIIHNTVAKFGTKKENKTVEITGYSAKELISHLNKGKYKWKDYMKNTHKNILFHIDHIIPISYFVKKGREYSKEELNKLISRVNDLRNLRIWPGRLNESKHDKIDRDLIREHGIEDLL